MIYLNPLVNDDEKLLARKKQYSNTYSIKTTLQFLRQAEQSAKKEKLSTAILGAGFYKNLLIIDYLSLNISIESCTCPLPN